MVSDFRGHLKEWPPSHSVDPTQQRVVGRGACLLPSMAVDQAVMTLESDSGYSPWREVKKTPLVSCWLQS